MNVYLQLPVSKDKANWGYSEGDEESHESAWTKHSFRQVVVDGDGTVRAWSDLGEYYSVSHDLTPHDETRARRMAALVRSGRRHTAAGFLLKKDKGNRKK